MPATHTRVTILFGSNNYYGGAKSEKWWHNGGRAADVLYSTLAQRRADLLGDQAFVRGIRTAEYDFTDAYHPVLGSQMFMEFGGPWLPRAAGSENISAFLKTSALRTAGWKVRARYTDLRVKYLSFAFPPLWATHDITDSQANAMGGWGDWNTGFAARNPRMAAYTGLLLGTTVVSGTGGRIPVFGQMHRIYRRQMPISKIVPSDGTSLSYVYTKDALATNVALRDRVHIGGRRAVRSRLAGRDIAGDRAVNDIITPTSPSTEYGFGVSCTIGKAVDLCRANGYLAQIGFSFAPLLDIDWKFRGRPTRATGKAVGRAKNP